MGEGETDTAGELPVPGASMVSMDEYWDKYEDKWERILGIFDVMAAWECGSLDGILPSGSPSRAAPNERLISLPRAIELFFEGEQTAGATAGRSGPPRLPVRRRFRRMTREDLRPRWEKVVAERRRLQEAGAWRDAVVESEKRREFQAALAEGTVETADASPAASRAVAWLLRPALRAAADQRDRADGGAVGARVALLRSAGTTPEERWTTAALLAGVEGELRELVDAARSASRSAPPRSTFDAWEADRDVADAGTGAVLGVVAAIATAAIVAALQP